MALRLARYFALPLLIALAWQCAGSVNQQFAFFFSTPSSIGVSFCQYFASGLLVRDLFATAYPTFAGFIVSSCFGTAIGLALSFENERSRLIRTYLSVLSNFPVFAIAPMMIVWFGIGPNMKVALAIFSTIFVSISHAYEGAMTVDQRQREWLRSMGASNRQLLRILLLPSSISWTFASMRLTGSLALLGTFVGEFMASEAGLGHRMLKAGGLYDVSQVLACSATMIGLVLAINGFVILLNRSRLAIIQFASVNPSLWIQRS